MAFEPGSKADKAKQALDINWLWNFYNLPGQPAYSCKSPFREDKSPSFSVDADGRGFFDYSNRQGGDCFDFIARCEGISVADAITRGIEIANVPGVENKAPVRRAEEGEYDKPPLEISHMMRDGSDDELTQLLALRKLPDETDALRYLEEIGMLRFMDCADIEDDKLITCWVVTDSTRKNAQIRRLDGKPIWVGSGDNRHLVKAKTIAGSQASWPLGLDNATKLNDHIIVTEGGPDLLTSAVLAASACVATSQYSPTGFSFICFTGCGNVFPDLSQKQWRDCKITAFGHRDRNRAGQKAVMRWMEQLQKTDCRDIYKWFYRPDEFASDKPIWDCPKDLNDAVSEGKPHVLKFINSLLSR